MVAAISTSDEKISVPAMSPGQVIHLQSGMALVDEDDHLKERLKIVCLDRCGVVEIINWIRAPKTRFLQLPVFEDLPDDVTVIDVWNDERRRCLCILVQHPTFGRVHPGLEPPYISETAYQTFQRIDFPNLETAG